MLRRQQHSAPRNPEYSGLIPDFCGGEAILTLAFIMQLVAVILVLATPTDPQLVLGRLVLTSLYLHWIGFSCAVLLCWARSWLGSARPQLVLAASWGFMLCLVAIISDVSFHAIEALLPRAFHTGESRYQFVARSVLVAAIVSVLVLRFFWVRDQWHTRIKTEGEARFQALAARIRPHFLFNSLNSIAALIPGQPEDAERMVENLADLFRESMAAANQKWRLSNEIELIEKYLAIEQVRIGPRMKLKWAIEDQILNAEIPSLSMQPLIENAVYHGAARCAGEVTIEISGKRQFNSIHLVIVNPMPPQDTAAHQGTGTATVNIAERLRLLYGNSARLEMRNEGEQFVVELVLPYREFAANKEVRA